MSGAATLVGLLLAMVVGLLAILQVDTLQTELTGLTSGALQALAGNLTIVFFVVIALVMVTAAAIAVGFALQRR